MKGTQIRDRVLTLLATIDGGAYSFSTPAGAASGTWSVDLSGTDRVVNSGELEHGCSPPRINVWASYGLTQEATRIGQYKRAIVLSMVGQVAATSSEGADREDAALQMASDVMTVIETDRYNSDAGALKELLAPWSVELSLQAGVMSVGGNDVPGFELSLWPRMRSP